MTFVVGDSLDFKSEMLMLAVFGSQSIHFIRSPLASTGQFVAVHVSEGVKTSSPCCNPGQDCDGAFKIWSARKRPDVAELSVNTKGLEK